MALDKPIFTTSNHSADADLRTKQYHLVKDTATGIALCSAVTDRPCGVLQNTPNTGETAVVMRIGQTKIVAGAAVAINSQIGPNAAGRAAAKIVGTDVTNYIIGTNAEAATADGQIVTAYISGPGAHRAV